MLGTKVVRNVFKARMIMLTTDIDKQADMMDSFVLKFCLPVIKQINIAF